MTEYPIARIAASLEKIERLTGQIYFIEKDAAKVKAERENVLKELAEMFCLTYESCTKDRIEQESFRRLGMEYVKSGAWRPRAPDATGEKLPGTVTITRDQLREAWAQSGEDEKVLYRLETELFGPPAQNGRGGE